MAGWSRFSPHSSGVGFEAYFETSLNKVFQSNCFGNHCSHMAKQSEQRENCSRVWNNFSHPSRCEKCICSTVRRRWETHGSALRRAGWLEAHLTTFVTINVSQLQTCFIYSFDHWHKMLYITITLHDEVGLGNISMRRSTVLDFGYRYIVMWQCCVLLLLKAPLQ